MAKQLYNEVFLNLVFMELNVKPKWAPVISLCLKVLSTESIKKNKLPRHLEKII